jgi:hypothetical protein
MKKFFYNYLNILKKVGIILLVLTFSSTYLEQVLSQLMQNELGSPDGASFMLWIWASLSLLMSLLLPPILILLSMFALQKELTLGSFLKTNAEQLIIEEVRAIGKSMLWGLLFIIPGFIRIVQFAFVPFVVLRDPAYQRGEIDALESSTRTINSRIFKIFALLFVFSFLIPLISTAWDDYKLVTEHPISALIWIFVEMNLSVLLVLLLLKEWEKAHGIDIQLETN